MAGEKNVVAMMMVVIGLLFGGQCLIKGVLVQANLAVVEQEFCLDHCIKGCKTSGIGPLKCFKYCENHCNSPAKPSPGWHYCKLGCMLEKCSKFHSDEGKQATCMVDCEKHICLAG
ncbi:OLC1v1018513C1 [Oldenlandia corymbosa var. corymbosa]|uniref:OLC1v1018513C1 n=1 Tax=Oldenlandia corymbosa var. corymbosa TaxID=529605 RepID=A0AAV1EC51_OLDCO|nr:OLC1v1018513C1 [Oldenlandia corymbosa var. corymbosa]